MKKILFGLAIAGLMSLPAAAAPIIDLVTFGGTGIYQNYPSGSSSAVTAGATTVEFVNLTTSAGICSGVGSIGCTSGDNVTESSLTFDSSTAGFTFTWDSGLVYTVNTGWSVAENNGVFSINTTGVYSYDANQQSGVLNFTWQQPFGSSPKQTSFSAAGSNVPEPGTMALLGMGLVGLGVMSRRRRKS